MAPRDQWARLIRERDRRLWRAMGWTLLVSASLVGVILGVVGLEISETRLSYRLDQLRQIQSDLEEVNRQLRVELSTLRALTRIELKARKELGMRSPLPDQVRIAREYVPGGSGTASLRTAWEARLAPPGARAR